MLDDELLEAFILESREGLEKIPHIFKTLALKPDDEASLAELYRAFHTIKGTAGFMGFEIVHRLAADAEALSSQLRKGQRKYEADSQKLLQESADVLEEILGCYERKADPDEARVEVLTLELKTFCAST